MPWSRTASAPGPIEPARASDGAAERASQPADADGRLAEGALGVDGPFAGQAEVGILEARSARLTASMTRLMPGSSLPPAKRPGRRPVRRRRPSRGGP